MEVNAGKAKLKGFVLLRDKNGKPKFDDYENCPKEIKDLLTETEKEEIENGFSTRNSN